MHVKKRKKDVQLKFEQATNSNRREKKSDRRNTSGFARKRAPSFKKKHDCEQKSTLLTSQKPDYRRRIVLKEEKAITRNGRYLNIHVKDALVSQEDPRCDRKCLNNSNRRGQKLRASSIREGRLA